MNILPGDMVKITAGPFSDFEGIIDKISEDRKNLLLKLLFLAGLHQWKFKSIK